MGFDSDATAHARQLVESFQAFIQEHKDEITALQILFSRPYAQRHLDFAQVRELAEQLNQHLQQADPLFMTEALWRAYMQLEKDRVRGAGRAAHPGRPGLAGAPCCPGRGAGALPGAGAAALPGMAGGAGSPAGVHPAAALVAGRDRPPHRHQRLDQRGGPELLRLPGPRRAGGGAEAVWGRAGGAAGRDEHQAWEHRAWHSENPCRMAGNHQPLEK